MCTTTEPVLEPVEVEADEFLIVDVGKGVVRSQLLYVFTISWFFVERSHNAIKGSVSLFVACKSQSDDDVTPMVLIQEEGCCRRK